MHLCHVSMTFFLKLVSTHHVFHDCPLFVLHVWLPASLPSSMSLAPFSCSIILYLYLADTLILKSCTFVLHLWMLWLTPLSCTVCFCTLSCTSVMPLINWPYFSFSILVFSSNLFVLNIPSPMCTIRPEPLFLVFKVYYLPCTLCLLICLAPSCPMQPYVLLLCHVPPSCPLNFFVLNICLASLNSMLNVFYLSFLHHCLSPWSRAFEYYTHVV